MTDVDPGRASGPVGALHDSGRSSSAGRAAIENVVILTASPLRVWSVLTDFAAHPQWKPFTQLAGEAVEGGLGGCIEDAVTREIQESSGLIARKSRSRHGPTLEEDWKSLL